MAAKYAGEGFRERFGPFAVVAGGSDGIGAAFARELAARGVHLLLIARREAPLVALAQQLSAEHGIEARTLAADLTRPDTGELVAEAAADLDAGLLVYNAGSNPSLGAFAEQSLEQHLFLADLSCRGPLLLAKPFADRLLPRGRGGIVLMSSLASIAGSSYNAVYAATKAFDTILAEGLWHELAPRGVDVLGVLAGATRTETALASGGAFADAMQPAEVARGALDHLGKGPLWVAGPGNQAAARGMWPVPRVALVNGMSQATAALFDLPHTAVAGLEFDES